MIFECFLINQRGIWRIYVLWIKTAELNITFFYVAEDPAYSFSVPDRLNRIFNQFSVIRVCGQVKITAVGHRTFEKHYIEAQLFMQVLDQLFLQQAILFRTMATFTQHNNAFLTKHR